MSTAKSIEEQITQFQESIATQLEPYMIVLVVNQEQDELLDFRIEPSGNMTALLALRQAQDRPLRQAPPKNGDPSTWLRTGSQDRPLRQAPPKNGAPSTWLTPSRCPYGRTGSQDRPLRQASRRRTTQRLKRTK